MAFDDRGLNLMLDNIGGTNLRVFGYTTPDAESVVTAVGYFAGASAYGVDVGDTIFVKCTQDGDATRTLALVMTVVAVDDFGNATAVVASTESINVKLFGARGDGVTDDTTAIQAALDAGQGRRVYIPEGTYQISDTLVIKYSGTRLQGETLGTGVFGQDTVRGTRLRWAGGVAAKPVVKMLLAVNEAPFSISGGEISNIWIDGNEQAAQCLFTPDAMAWRFEDLFLTGATQRAWDMSGIEGAAGLNSLYNCTVDNVHISVRGSCDGLYAGFTTSPGQHPAFVSFNNVHITWLNGVGANLLELDDCSFTNLAFSRVAGGTGDALILGSQAVGNTFRCLNVSQQDGSDPGIIARAGSKANYMEFAGIDFNVGPTVEANAELFYIYTGNYTSADSNSAFAYLPPLRVPNRDLAGPKIFDWYEEGFLNLTLNFGGSSNGITYVDRVAKFQRVGNTVNVTGRVLLSSKGAETGNATITGLPYTSSSTNEAYGIFVPRNSFANSALSAGVYCELTSSSGTIILRKTNSTGTGTEAVTNADFTDNSDFGFSISYSAA